MVNQRMDLKNRWVSLIRGKASDYEHKARSEGRTVTSPSLDSIASEIEAFFIGLS